MTRLSLPLVQATGGVSEAPALPDPRAITVLAERENFAVAARVLPSSLRQHLMAIYGYCRLVDFLGDEMEGDRIALLDWLEEEVRTVHAGGEGSYLLTQRLRPTISAFDIPLQPLLDLIEANRQDQVKNRYATWDELLAYCRLSANPVGRLVLRIFGASSNDIDKRSDAVCTALQVIEHLQDVAEDLGRDRVYLPLDDLARFGVDVEDLAGGPHDPAVRELVSFECDRTRALLDSGRRIVADLSGWGRLAVAGYVGGGYAALEALERSRSDRRRAGRVSRVKHVGAALASGGRVG